MRYWQIKIVCFWLFCKWTEMENTELRSLFHNQKLQHRHGTGMATRMERNLCETHTAWTDDRGEAWFVTESIWAVPCAYSCWNFRSGYKHCQGCCIVFQALCSRFMASKLGFKITGMYSIFFFFLASECCWSSMYIFFFPSEKFPVPREWFVDLLIFFSAFFPALFFDWFAKANLTFDVYGIYWNQLSKILHSCSLVKHNQIQPQAHLEDFRILDQVNNSL